LKKKFHEMLHEIIKLEKCTKTIKFICKN